MRLVYTAQVQETATGEKENVVANLKQRQLHKLQDKKFRVSNEVRSIYTRLNLWMFIGETGRALRSCHYSPLRVPCICYTTVLTRDFVLL